MDAVRLGRDLEKIVEGDVYWDRVMRALYSTDASIYEVMPLAIVFPKNVGDVINVVKYGYRNGVSIHARGAGSSLAGQAIGSGIILDFSKYMNRIIEINVKENYVWVEPGIVMEKLNEELKKYGKFFPPDPASSHFCTIGGMIGNNASGMRSVKYGNTIDYVEELKVVLSNGDIILTKPIDINSSLFKEKLSLNTFEGEIYREIYKLFRENRDLIFKSMPRIKKNASGYRIEYLVKNNLFNLSKIFVGSEGTLGIVVAAKLRIIDLPKKRGLLVAYFDSLEGATKSILTLLKYGPSALEIMDKKYIDLVRTHYDYMRERIPVETESILIVEFEGENEWELKEKLDTVKDLLGEPDMAFNVEIALGEEERENLFEVRRAAIPIINKTRGLRKYPAFIEDLVVPPEKLLDLIKGMYNILEKYGLDTIIFGHAGQGNIHTHPPINLKDPIDIDRMRTVCKEIYRLVVKLGGAISGEHGNGRLRTQFMKMEYPELLNIFRRIKKIFDPRNILNPGPKINYDDYYMVSNLRYGLDYNVKHNVLKTMLNFRPGEFEEEIEMCHGCGKCRTLTNVLAICPAFRATLDERYTPRSKANLWRWIIKENGLNLNTLYSIQSMITMFDGCIGCNLCSIECISEINIPKLVREARTRIASKNGLKEPYNIISDDKMFIKMLGSENIDYIKYNIHSGFKLPKISRESFIDWFNRNIGVSDFKYILLIDYNLNYIEPELGKALYHIFSKIGLGFKPVYRNLYYYSIAYGNWKNFYDKIVENKNILSDFIENGYAIIVLELNTFLALKKYYQEIFGEDFIEIARNVYDVSQILFDRNIVNMFSKLDVKTVYHKPCRSKLYKLKYIDLLKSIPGLNLTVVDEYCCGMGEFYGVFKEYYERCINVGKNVFKKIDEIGPEYIVTECELGRYWFRNKYNINIVHPIILLRESMR